MSTSHHVIKFLFLFLLSVFLFSCGKKKTILKSVEGYNYNYLRSYEKIYGTVKFVTEVEYTVLKRIGDSVVIEPVYKTQYIYDKTGNEKEVNAYYMDGRFHWRLEGFYNSDGTLNHLKYYNDAGELRYISNYEYDSKADLICFKDYLGKDSGILSTTTYTHRGAYEVEITHYSFRNSQSVKLIEKYDKLGNLTDEKHYGSDNNISSSVVFGYDSLGNRKKQTTHHENGSTDILIYKYRGNDKNGNWLERFSIVNDTPISKTERSFEY